MAPMPAIRPKIRHLLLWLLLAAPAFYLSVTAHSDCRVSVPRPTGAVEVSSSETRPHAGGLKLLRSAPAVSPGLVTLEIVLPRKFIASPAMFTAPFAPPGNSSPVPGRKYQRRLIKPVNHQYRHIIHQAADRHGIDPAMILAIIMAESSFNPNAVSSRGAQGLMQLMPQTAESLGVANAFDPGKNIDAGVRYFRWLLNHCSGDIQMALAAYNAGLQNVRNHNGIPPFKTTRRYVEKVLIYYEHYKRMLTG